MAIVRRIKYVGAQVVVINRLFCLMYARRLETRRSGLFSDNLAVKVEKTVCHLNFACANFCGLLCYHGTCIYEILHSCLIRFFLFLSWHTKSAQRFWCLNSGRGLRSFQSTFNSDDLFLFIYNNQIIWANFHCLWWDICRLRRRHLVRVLCVPIRWFYLVNELFTVLAAAM